jgi:acyl carrier protein
VKDLESRLHQVVRSIFGTDSRELSDVDSPRTIKGWDSAGHIQLILALEMEFDVRLEPGEIGHLTTIGDIRRRLQQETA